MAALPPKAFLRQRREWATARLGKLDKKRAKLDDKTAREKRRLQTLDELGAKYALFEESLKVYQQQEGAYRSLTNRLLAPVAGNSHLAHRFPPAAQEPVSSSCSSESEEEEECRTRSRSPSTRQTPLGAPHRSQSPPPAPPSRRIGQLDLPLGTGRLPPHLQGGPGRQGGQPSPSVPPEVSEVSSHLEPGLARQDASASEVR